MIEGLSEFSNFAPEVDTLIDMFRDEVKIVIIISHFHQRLKTYNAPFKGPGGYRRKERLTAQKSVPRMHY
jgi:hypothetical protein